jgi:hypothetical protein
VARSERRKPVVRGKEVEMEMKRDEERRRKMKRKGECGGGRQRFITGLCSEVSQMVALTTAGIQGRRDRRQERCRAGKRGEPEATDKAEK